MLLTCLLNCTRCCFEARLGADFGRHAAAQPPRVFATVFLAFCGHAFRARALASVRPIASLGAASVYTRAVRSRPVFLCTHNQPSLPEFEVAACCQHRSATLHAAHRIMPTIKVQKPDQETVRKNAREFALLHQLDPASEGFDAQV